MLTGGLLLLAAPAIAQPSPSADAQGSNPVPQLEPGWAQPASPDPVESSSAERLPSDSSLPIAPASPDATASPEVVADSAVETTAEELELDPDLVEDSPVFQRWLDEIPDVREDIRRDPSFRTRLRVESIQTLSGDDASGIAVGLEDVFIGRTGLTLSGDYETTFDGDRESFGTDLRYHVLPLGNSVNLAPQVGYRHLETDDFDTDGVNVGLRFILVPTRTGAADISISQSWVNPGSDRQEVSLTTLALGYALTDHVRLGTRFQWQKTPEDGQTVVGVGLQWMF